jgi:hypothetical protein
VPATYGAGDRPKDDACALCPNAKAYSFVYKSGEDYTPGVVARLEATSPGDCLAEFVQLQAGAWELQGAVEEGSESTLAACAGVCKTETTCQFFTFDYTANADKPCKWKKYMASSTPG